MRKAAKRSNRGAKRRAGPVPTVVFLHGPPASGKLTIAREVCALTGFQLFHNHLVVDLLLSLFPFGSAGFVRHREAIWLELIEESVAGGRSLVFTFTPESSVKPGYPARLARRIRRAGGAVRFVAVRCSEETIEARMGAGSRRRHGKLVSPELYRELRRNGAFAYSPIDSEIEIDSTSARPNESALKIVETLRLLPTAPVRGNKSG